MNEVLQDGGVPAQVRRLLVDTWVREGDFLLAANLGRFDTVVGNPPYIRIEQLSPDLQSEYRRRFESLYDRADLYVAFIQRGLDLLTANGTLSLICADRWTRNRYGSQLRRIVTERYRLKAYIDLNQASPFESDVIAYPSIFALSPGESSNVFVAHLPTGNAEECAAVITAFHDSGVAPGIQSAIYDSWFAGEEPWVLGSPEHLAALRKLETDFTTLEGDGQTRVGIGIASGNDKVYIVPEGADIEADRLLPLVMRSDIEKGQIQNAHRCVINTFEGNGGVIDLRRYPRLSAYFEKHAEVVRKRHVAQRSGDGWFRTIDRAYPALVPKPKLLIPDIAGSNEVTFDEGHYHPHHNLYFVTSDSWDLEVLGGLLSSRVALYFIWSYATKMRGGYLRFQAQYLRRIRVPDPAKLSPAIAEGLRNAFRSRDFTKLDSLAMRAYQLKTIPDFEFVDTRA